MNKRVKRVPIIALPVESVLKLAEVYNVTRAAIYNALNYHSNSEQARKIRKDAIELYGGVSDTKPVFV